ncbi:MAG: hypothetical protein QM538_03985 [Methylacidiphilales bacterium]|nr:hypothetical protein [Candidatus Methylacidiphilales bacterium]
MKKTIIALIIYWLGIGVANSADLFVPALPKEGSIIFAIERDYYYRGFTRSNKKNSTEFTFAYQTSDYFKISTQIKSVDFPFDPLKKRKANYQINSSLGFDFDFPEEHVRFDFGTNFYNYPGSASALQKKYDYQEVYALLTLGTVQYNVSIATFLSDDYFNSNGKSSYYQLGLNINIARGLDFLVSGSRFTLHERDLANFTGVVSSTTNYDLYELGLYMGLPEFNIVAGYSRVGLSEKFCPIYNGCKDKFNFKLTVALD